MREDHKSWMFHVAAWTLAVLMFGAMASLGGCNTVEGVGEDVQEVGEGVEDAAN